MGAAMTDPTCPYCGAERHAKYAGIYACGTAIESQRYLHRYCLQRKITQQAAEIEHLKADVQSVLGTVQAAVQMEREACSKVADNFVGCEQISAAIKARGEP
jgi:transposase-like protein